MGYYRGDYYRGDYYTRFRGDPGLFGALGRLAGRVAGPLLKSVPILGTAISVGEAVSGLVGGGRGATAAAPPLPMLPAAPMIARPAGVSAPAIAAGRTHLTAGGRGIPWHPGEPLLPGHHLKTVVSPGGTVAYLQVKRKHMNVANAKALRRGLRRAHGFLRLAKRAAPLMGMHLVRGSVRRKGARFGKRR